MSRPSGAIRPHEGGSPHVRVPSEPLEHALAHPNPHVRARGEVGSESAPKRGETSAPDRVERASRAELYRDGVTGGQRSTQEQDELVDVPITVQLFLRLELDRGGVHEGTHGEGVPYDPVARRVDEYAVTKETDLRESPHPPRHPTPARAPVLLVEGVDPEEHLRLLDGNGAASGTHPPADGVVADDQGGRRRSEELDNRLAEREFGVGGNIRPVDVRRRVCTRILETRLAVVGDSTVRRVCTRLRRLVGVYRGGVRASSTDLDPRDVGRDCNLGSRIRPRLTDDGGCELEAATDGRQGEDEKASERADLHFLFLHFLLL